MPSSSWPTMPVGCSGRYQFSSAAVIELCVAGNATSSYRRIAELAVPVAGGHVGGTDRDPLLAGVGVDCEHRQEDEHRWEERHQREPTRKPQARPRLLPPNARQAGRRRRAAAARGPRLPRRAGAPARAREQRDPQQREDRGAADQTGRRRRDDQRPPGPPLGPGWERCRELSAGDDGDRSTDDEGCRHPPQRTIQLMPGGGDQDGPQLGPFGQRVCDDAEGQRCAADNNPGGNHAVPGARAGRRPVFAGGHPDPDQQQAAQREQPREHVDVMREPGCAVGEACHCRSGRASRRRRRATGPRHPVPQRAGWRSAPRRHQPVAARGGRSPVTSARHGAGGRPGGRRDARPDCPPPRSPPTRPAGGRPPGRGSAREPEP